MYYRNAARTILFVCSQSMDTSTYTVIVSLVVYWCTELAKAASREERERLEAQMRSDPALERILAQLRDTSESDVVREERAKRLVERQRRLDAEIAAQTQDEAQDTSVCEHLSLLLFRKWPKSTLF